MHHYEEKNVKVETMTVQHYNYVFCNNVPCRKRHKQSQKKPIHVLFTIKYIYNIGKREKHKGDKESAQNGSTKLCSNQRAPQVGAWDDALSLSK